MREIFVMLGGASSLMRRSGRYPAEPAERKNLAMTAGYGVQAQKVREKCVQAEFPFTGTSFPR
jgi:hypothetical protein